MKTQASLNDKSRPKHKAWFIKLKVVFVFQIYPKPQIPGYESVLGRAGALQGSTGLEEGLPVETGSKRALQLFLAPGKILGLL